MTDYSEIICTCPLRSAWRDQDNPADHETDCPLSEVVDVDDHEKIRDALAYALGFQREAGYVTVATASLVAAVADLLDS